MSLELILAPMEGVTDAPIREIFGQIGGFDRCVSEFIRVSQEVLPQKTFKSEIPEWQNAFKTQSGLPVQVQILGGHPERMAQSALKAIEIGASGIDINFGCPAPTVNRNDGGASLLRYPDRIQEIVSAVRQSVPKTLPVSAKLRLGWDSIDDILLNAEKAALGGANWITIHARTRTQGYQPPVNWYKIGEVRKNLDIPVIANGDIWTLDDFKRCQEITGCERFMLGRSAMANPFLALEIKGHSHNLETRSLLQNLKPWLHRFVEISGNYSKKPDSHQSSRYIGARLKQWLRMIKNRNPLPELDPLFRLEHPDQILTAFDLIRFNAI